ncbi:hypothetical protein ACFYNO_34695 [Kitasatospora sp. NPDC006697]|uniref:hypothetical protein n=1 Tax=Kitasatospora sp. NPDC006697 TaxID=3364020 RepID=UPI0036C03A9F
MSGTIGEIGEIGEIGGTGPAVPASGTAAEAGAPAAPALPKHLAALPEDLSELRLPTWYFGFESVFACAYDLIKAYPSAWPALVALAAVNIALSLTLMRRRLKLAKALWQGKRTRFLALGLLALRIGSHAALAAVGVAVDGTAAHLAFAVAMGAVTLGLLAFTQRTALRALDAERARAHTTAA